MTIKMPNNYEEQGIVTIYLPVMPMAELLEIHAAIKTALGGLDKFKIDFRIMGQKDGGGLVNAGKEPCQDNH